FDGLEQRRPDEACDQPDQGCKSQGLGDECQIEVHCCALPVQGATGRGRGLPICRVRSTPDRTATPSVDNVRRSYGARPPTRNGLAKANSRPTATLMMNAASIRPAVMNMRTCSTGISSG